MNGIVPVKYSKQVENWLFEESKAVKIIEKMAPRRLMQLINFIGLEDASEIVAFTTSKQLENIFDIDLWKNEKPGEEEKFDFDRFAIWLKIMVDVSESFAAEKLMELDEDLVTLALCKLIWIIDLETIMLSLTNSERSFDDDLTDKILENSLSLEWDQYHIISKDDNSWDAIISVMTELDKKDHYFLNGLLQRICYISTEYIEGNGGLYNVLSSEDMLESNLAANRETRRSHKGFVSPSAAITFLSMAQSTPLKKIEKSKTPDYITRLYFDDIKTDLNQFPKSHEELNANRLPDSVKQNQLVESINDNDILIFKVIRMTKKQNQNNYTQCIIELNYLANILISGYPYENRTLNPIEATERVLSTINSGLNYLLKINNKKNSVISLNEVAKLVMQESLVKLFKIGWNLLNNKTEPI